MSNEELAALIQAGETARLLDLWAAVRRFAHDWAYRWARATDGRSGMTIGDFMQCAFLALLGALEGWKPDGGSFLTWYGFKLRAAFAEACGQRTARERRDPLRTAVSLDAPLTDNDGDPLTLADIIEDPAAAMEIEAIAEKDSLQRRHRAIEAALATLPEDQRAAVVGKYCYGRKTDTRACNAGLRALRHPSISRTLRKYI